MSIPASTSRFVRIARWCTRHRWQTFVAWLLLVVAAIALGQAVGTQKIDSFRLPDTESQQAYDVLAQHSPTENGITDQLVYVARSGSLKDPAQRARIDTSLDRLRTDPALARVAVPRLAPDGRIGVVDITYAGKAENLDVDDVKRVQTTAFQARGPGL